MCRPFDTAKFCRNWCRCWLCGCLFALPFFIPVLIVCTIPWHVGISQALTCSYTNYQITNDSCVTEFIPRSRTGCSSCNLVFERPPANCNVTDTCGQACCSNTYESGVQCLAIRACWTNCYTASVNVRELTTNYTQNFTALCVNSLSCAQETQSQWRDVEPMCWWNGTGLQSLPYHSLLRCPQPVLTEIVTFSIGLGVAFLLICCGFFRCLFMAQDSMVRQVQIANSMNSTTYGQKPPHVPVQISLDILAKR